MAKKQHIGHFIKLPEDYNVSTKDKEGDDFRMHATGIYVTWDHSRAWLQYAGEKAGESHAVIEIPSDPAYLRKFARELTALAKKIEQG